MAGRVGSEGKPNLDVEDPENVLKELEAQCRPKQLEKEKKKQEQNKQLSKRHKPPRQGPQLPVGVIINTDNSRYKVVSILGSGGFGDVYKVKQLDDAKKGEDFFALKTEKNSAGRALNRLKIEMAILQESDSLPEEKRRHFVKLIDRGRTESFKFIIMELVGASIDKLQKEQPEKHFSFSTTIKLGLETLEGIEHLHEFGYLHRDIKPQNFTIGLDKKRDTVYLLDFGIARRYMDKDSKAVRIPRETVRFLGTVRFASRNCHRSREQCRRDDLESWSYMLMEFTQYACLPWSRIVDRNVVCREKERLFAGYYTKHIAHLPEEIHKILSYINELDYQDVPDYSYIATLLKQAAARKNADLDLKFDWDNVESSKAIGSTVSTKTPSVKSKSFKTKVRSREPEEQNF